MRKFQCDRADNLEATAEGEVIDYQKSADNPQYFNTKYNQPCKGLLSKVHVAICAHSPLVDEHPPRVVINSPPVFVLNDDLVKPRRVSEYSFEHVYSTDDAAFALYGDLIEPQVDNFMKGMDSGVISIGYSNDVRSTQINEITKSVLLDIFSSMSGTAKILSVKSLLITGNRVFNLLLDHQSEFFVRTSLNIHAQMPSVELTSLDDAMDLFEKITNNQNQLLTGRLNLVHSHHVVHSFSLIDTDTNLKAPGSFFLVDLNGSFQDGSQYPRVSHMDALSETLNNLASRKLGNAASKKPFNVHFKYSLLTEVIAPILYDNSHTSVIAHICTARCVPDESQQILHFAHIANNVVRSGWNAAHFGNPQPEEEEEEEEPVQRPVGNKRRKHYSEREFKRALAAALAIKDRELADKEKIIRDQNADIREKDDLYGQLSMDYNDQKRERFKDRTSFDTQLTAMARAGAKTSRQLIQVNEKLESEQRVSGQLREALTANELQLETERQNSAALQETLSATAMKLAEELASERDSSSALRETLTVTQLQLENVEEALATANQSNTSTTGPPHCALERGSSPNLCMLEDVVDFCARGKSTCRESAIEAAHVPMDLVEDVVPTFVGANRERACVFDTSDMLSELFATLQIENGINFVTTETEQQDERRVSDFSSDDNTSGDDSSSPSSDERQSEEQSGLGDSDQMDSLEEAEEAPLTDEEDRDDEQEVSQESFSEHHQQVEADETSRDSWNDSADFNDSGGGEGEYDEYASGETPPHEHEGDGGSPHSNPSNGAFKLHEHPLSVTFDDNSNEFCGEAGGGGEEEHYDYAVGGTSPHEEVENYENENDGEEEEEDRSDVESESESDTEQNSAARSNDSAELVWTPEMNRRLEEGHKYVRGFPKIAPFVSKLLGIKVSAEQCKKQWKVIDPKRRRRLRVDDWTQEEIDKLMAFVSNSPNDDIDWRLIAKELFIGVELCEKMWKQQENKQKKKRECCEDEDIKVDKTVGIELHYLRITGRFTCLISNQDARLIKGMEQFRPADDRSEQTGHFDLVAVYVGCGLTPTQCQNRWQRVNPELNDHKKGPWAVEELHKLRALAEEEMRNPTGGKGINWMKIGKELNRDNTECKHKWDSIRGSDMKTGPFTAEEEDIINESVREWGNKGHGLWRVLERKLGRTSSSIKNRWERNYGQCYALAKNFL